MSVTCVFGAQWGDEGKGKIIDLLSRSADVVVRYQGGANAGHTVRVQDEEFVLHLVPSGILHGGKRCVIANGVVVDPELLLEEVDGLARRGIDVSGRLFISHRAHMVLPYHKLLDQCAEKARGAGRIGTTGRGIGPAYADRALRSGLRVGELLEPAVLTERLRAVLDEKNLVLERVYGVRPLAFNDVRDRLMQQGERLRPMICDTTQLLMEADDAGQRVLLEGAQGGLLDVDFGTYPYVTSSNSSALGITAGAGLPPRRIGRTLGVVKAYTSRVGEGPFPTEEKGETGERIRKQGREYGATTGRPRRCGWFDAVAVRYVIMLNGIDTLAVTNLDVLKGFPSIRVCVGYRLDGREVSAAAPDIATLQKVEPIYREFPGFEEDIGAVRRFADLPEAARRYVEFLESTLGVPFGIVSVGQERDRVIFRQDFKL